MSWSMCYSEVSRSGKRWGGVKKYYESLTDFQSDTNIPNGLSSIQAECALLDISIDVVKGKPLYVFFNGAQRRNDNFKLPVFSGRGITPVGEVSRLSISDPALYFAKDLSMGWYAGTRFFSTQKILIPAVIDKISSVAQPSKIIFIGGSSGGFASLYFSKRYEDSIALVCNPQTNILRYHSAHVKRYIKYCFGVEEISQIRDDPSLMRGITKNVCHFYKGEIKNKIIYMQNKDDKHHLKNHFLPFVKSFGINPNLNIGCHQYGNLLNLMGDWGEGHQVAPRRVWADILSDLSNNLDCLDTLFERGEANSLVRPNAEYAK
ncbi:MAG TPA: hypothetical protein DD644_05005 [Halomonas sp.]|nr:hypothetical protein [Halomonas sp. 3A7M]HBP41099.1 hypothetical protein [Halomonas sp.]